jgi:hypothetical protein
MTRTVTILASDPALLQTDPPLEAVRLKLPTTSETHKVFRASSVEQLAGVLRKVSAVPEERPDLIEIVGHGQAGLLSLGFHFTSRYSEKRRGPYYVLDSNPNVYGVLNKPMKPSAEVRLLGCSVADTGDGPRTMVADGATLIFDLARMWRCKVSAPAGVISADDFGLDGTFARPADLLLVDGNLGVEELAFKGRGIRAAGASLPQGEVIQGSASKPTVHLKNIRPTLLSPPIVVPGTTSEELNEIFGEPIELQNALALPEAVFEGTCDGQPIRAEMIGNGRVLRVDFGDVVDHFAAKLTAWPRVRQIVRELLAPGYRPSLKPYPYPLSSLSAA